MTILTGLLLNLAEWALSNFAQLGLKWAQNYQDNKKIKDQAETDATLLSKAKTDEDKTLAARKIADDTFNN